MQQRTPEHTYTHTPVRIHIHIYPVPSGRSFYYSLHTPTHLQYIGLSWDISTQNIVFTACFILNISTYFDLL